MQLKIVIATENSVIDVAKKMMRFFVALTKILFLLNNIYILIKSQANLNA